MWAMETPMPQMQCRACAAGASCGLAMRLAVTFGCPLCASVPKPTPPLLSPSSLGASAFAGARLRLWDGLTGCEVAEDVAL